MKLKEYPVCEFRSIWDAGPIKVDGQIACFVDEYEVDIRNLRGWLIVGLLIG